MKMQRFPWSRDILGEASHADEVDHDLLMKLLMGGGKKKAAAKCKEGDLVECDLCVGTVKAVVRDGAAYVLEKQDKTGFLVMPSASWASLLHHATGVSVSTTVCLMANASIELRLSLTPKFADSYALMAS